MVHVVLDSSYEFLVVWSCGLSLDPRWTPLGLRLKSHIGTSHRSVCSLVSVSSQGMMPELVAPVFFLSSLNTKKNQGHSFVLTLICSSLF